VPHAQNSIVCFTYTNTDGDVASLLVNFECYLRASAHIHEEGRMEAHPTTAVAAHKRGNGAVRTSELRRYIAQQASREAACPAAPVLLLLVALAFLCGWLHSQPAVAVQSELPLVRSVIGDMATTAAALVAPVDVYAWIEGDVLPLLLPGEGTAVPQWQLVGGLRVTQWRAATTPCSLDARLSALLPSSSGACVVGDEGDPLLSGSWREGVRWRGKLATSLASGAAAIGSPGAAIAALNGTASAATIGCAFRPLVPSSGGAPAWLSPASAGASVQGAGYHAILLSPASAGRATPSAIMQALRAGAWLDSSTAYVRVSAVGLNPSAGRWMAVAWDVAFVRGGAVHARALAGSLPLDPSPPFAVVPVLDALTIALALVLALMGAASATRTLVAAAYRTCGQETGGARNAILELLPALLDVGASTAIWVCVAAWGEMSAGIEAARAAALVGAASSATAPGAGACFGAPGTDAFSSTIALHAAVGAAMDGQSMWRKASGASVALLTLRTLRVFTLQPHMAGLVDALASAALDLGHLGLVFGTLLFGHAVWAGLAFGSQVPSFSSLPDGLNSLLRMAMFDYALEPLATQDAPGAAVFYACFMLGVTHLVLWTWLGVALEGYSTIRAAARDRPALPTLARDAWTGVMVAPALASELLASAASAPAAARAWWRAGMNRGASEEDLERCRSLVASCIVSRGGLERVGREVMMAAHTLVAACMAPSTPLTTVDTVSAVLRLPPKAAVAVLQHYLAGDDCSSASRARLVRALQARVESQESGSAESVAVDGSTAAEGKGDSGANDWLAYTSTQGPGWVGEGAGGGPAFRSVGRAMVRTVTGGGGWVRQP